MSNDEMMTMTMMMMDLKLERFAWGRSQFPLLLLLLIAVVIEAGHNARWTDHTAVSIVVPRWRRRRVGCWWSDIRHTWRCWWRHCTCWAWHSTATWSISHDHLGNTS